jgi:hypothetical protein
VKRFRRASMSPLLRLGLRLGCSRHSSVVNIVLQATEAVPVPYLIA